jgi:hypothetical protein
MNDMMTRFHQPIDSLPFPSDLEEILLKGFVSREGCIFFRKFVEDKGTASSDMRKTYFDEIGYECFVNHFHFKGGSEGELATVAAEFCRRAHAIWEKSNLSGELRFIVSIRDHEATVRFHLIREGNQWLADDLNSYKNEAILVYDTIMRKDH